MSAATDRAVKEAILDRLFKAVGICGHCGKRRCPQPVAPHLPPRLNMQVVIDAIDLDDLLSSDPSTNQE